MINSSPRRLLTVEDRNSVLLKFMFSGAVGPAKGKSVEYSLLSETEDCFYYIAALTDETNEEDGVPVDRFQTGDQSRIREG